MRAQTLAWLLLVGAQVSMAAKPDTIVFCLTERDQLGNRGLALYRINTDGSGAKRILPANPNGVMMREPDVGPVDRKIVLFLYPTLYTCAFDGTQITKLFSLPREHMEPRWSPDGARIVFATDRHENSDVYVMNADGTGQRNLTLSPLSVDMSPGWSPDGRQVVFASNRHGSFDVFAMDDGGLNLRALTRSPADDRLPVWSPRGDTIVFVTERDGNREIYSMNPDGTEARNLTRHPAWDSEPAVSPDGKTIAFVSDRDGTSDVFLMKIDGTGVRKLTHYDNANTSYPCFVPRQRKPSAPPPARVKLTRPRLLVTPQSLPALRARVAKPGQARVEYQALVAGADALLDRGSKASKKLQTHVTTKHSTKSATLYFDAVRRMALVWLASGNKKYATRACELLAAGLKAYGDDYVKGRYSMYGHMRHWVLAYDWLYTEMPAEQRERVRKLLVAYCEKSYERLQRSHSGFGPLGESSPVAGNINWLHSGLFGLPVLALEGEEGYQEAWYYGARRLVRRVWKTWIGPKGAVVEEAAYLNWIGTWVMEFMSAIVRRDREFDYLGRFRRVPEWIAYETIHGGPMSNNLGDHNGGWPRQIFPFLIGHYPDHPIVDWLWQRMHGEAEAAGKTLVADPVQTVLWWRPTRRDVRPEKLLPPARLFPVNGLVYMRTGWGERDLVMSLSSRYYAGHGQADSLHFTLYAHGMDYAVDCAYGVSAPEAHNVVLVDGWGQARTFREDPVGSHVLDFVCSRFASFGWVTARGQFAVFRSSHGTRSRFFPWFPLKRAGRLGAMVMGSHGVPPYALVVDDITKGDRVRSYEWRLHSQTNNRFRVTDHGALLTRDYTGAGLHPPHNVKGTGEVAFPPIDVRGAGTYFVWVLCRGQSYLKFSIDGKRFFGRPCPYPTRGQHWQWQPLKPHRTKDKTARVQVPLSAGKHTLKLHFHGWRGADVAKLLFTTNADFRPFYSDDDPGKTGLVVRASSATQVDKPWERVEPDPGTPLVIRFLNPAPIAFDTSPYRYRTVHFGKQWIRIPMLMATRRAHHPHFVVMLYPRAKGQPEPKVTRMASGGAITATLGWPTATDTIVRPTKPGEPVGGTVQTDGLVAMCRRSRRGGVPSLFLSLGTRVRVDGTDLIRAPGPVSLAYHDGELVVNAHGARGDLVVRTLPVKRVVADGSERRFRAQGDRVTVRLGD